MLSETIANFQKLRRPVRSLVFLFWIYSFTGALIGVFTQIFLYQRFADITLNVYATQVFFTGIMVGFVILGYIASLLRRNIKNGFLASFLVIGSSVTVLLFSSTIEVAYFAMFLNGIGQGLFWLTIHTFELAETKSHERDFYSSLLTAGGQLSLVAGPALATVLIWFSENILAWDTFTVLFILTPFCYLLGLFCFSDIQDYYPKAARWADLKHFFSERKNLVSQLYLLGGNIGVVAGGVIPPLAILLILGGAVNVGVYNTLFALFSAICVLSLVRYRTTSNRLYIFGIATVILALATILFGFYFGLFFLIIYTITQGILAPILRVSAHVIDLETMESIGRSDSDFYSTMLLRDLSLFVWRIMGGFVFLGFLSLFSSEESLIGGGLYFIAFSLITTFFGAYFLLKVMKPKL